MNKVCQIAVYFGLMFISSLSFAITSEIERDAYSFWNEQSQSIRHLSHIYLADKSQDNHDLDSFSSLNAQVFDNFAQSLSKDCTKLVALEWGCGGGANAVELCKKFKKIFLVDISEQSIAACKERLESAGVSNFEFIHLSTLRDFEKLKNIRVDAIFSTAVFQHFPSKEYAREVLLEMSKILSSKGFIMIQVRQVIEAELPKEKVMQYAKEAIVAITFSGDEFCGYLAHAGFLKKYTSELYQSDYLYCFAIKP
jgi:ubiquinone/menaquinone biosynthesis C-methylase UbiE